MKFIFLYSIFILFLSCSVNRKQTFSVSDLEVSWSVVENLGSTYVNSWKISNTGEAVLPATGWTLYYNHVAGVPVPETNTASLKVTQITGTFYSITPTPSFKALGAGESIRLNLECFGNAIKITHAPGGLYMIFDDEPNPVTLDLKVQPFLQLQQTTRASYDHVPVPTTELRYEQNQSLSFIQQSEDPSIVPTPKQIITGNGQFDIPSQLIIGYQKGLENEAELLLNKLQILGQSSSLTDDMNSAHIKLSIYAAIEGEEENYRLKIEPDAISIQGSDPSGVFYGAQSLISLWPLEQSSKLHCQTIIDAPRFAYRGMYLDVSRNFQKPDAIKKTLDIMAFYKLNRLMFGISNDEGWRLEITSIPELTSVGAVRGHTEDELDHLTPAYGSGPFPQGEDNYGTGHYTREEFIDILQYASQRHIEVIPEINFPGHARAAVKSMTAREARLAAGDIEGPSYRLHDPDDQSKYSSVQGYTDNVICPCQESVYQFLETVVGEVVEMYQDAGVKLTSIHTGGDEVPTGIWEQSPLCREFLKENPQVETVTGLSGYFLSRYHQILAQHELVTAGWEEIAMHYVDANNLNNEDQEASQKVLVPNPEFVDANFLAYVWNADWGTNDDLAYKLANLGYKVILSNANNLYFDFAYNKDPLEPGFYWAGLVDTRKPYEFVPLDVLKTATVDIMGNTLEMDDYLDKVKLTEAGKNNVSGIQGQLWSETVKGQPLMEYYLYPKMIGLSERAWAPDPEWANLPRKSQRLAGLEQAWNGFANRLGQRELVRLDQLWGGVNYRVPLPGAIIEKGKLKANVAFPGLSIRYTLDGSEPTVNSTRYQGPVDAKKPVKLKSFTSTGKSSRTSILTY